MPDHTEKPLKPDDASTDLSKYLIHSRLEIAAILGTLRKAGRTVTAYFGTDNDFILTSIAGVLPEQNAVLADYGADAAATRRALQARNITFVAVHDRIKIQFVAESLRPARLGGRDVFSMALPATLLRLQRREYFRIATPLTRPLVCTIAPQALPVRAPATVTIVDISCGGIAVIDSGEPADIEAGVRLRGCRIPLPELGEVTADILVKSTFEVTLKNGKMHRHAGCEFVDMKERDRALVQRYVSRLERERKDRTGGR
jgi:c-di-GMP-binding flagellar brake protein YcgR